jgi:hypothetical protein
MLFFNVNISYDINLACCVPMFKKIDVKITYDMYLTIYYFKSMTIIIEMKIH